MEEKFIYTGYKEISNGNKIPCFVGKLILAILYIGSKRNDRSLKQYLEQLEALLNITSWRPQHAHFYNYSFGKKSWLSTQHLL